MTELANILELVLCLLQNENVVCKIFNKIIFAIDSAKVIEFYS